LPDLAGFGRREMRIAPDDAYALTLYQIGALDAMARAAGARVAHVKPHGALYNMAAKDRTLAEAIAKAVRDFDRDLVLVGLAGSELPSAGEDVGLHVAYEAFADRRYEADGSLMARSRPGAVLDDVETAVAQAIAIATRGEVDAGGTRLRIRADTICVHGDRADAAAFARGLRSGLEAASVTIAPLTTRRAA
jgi:UPF0271 protein